MNNFEALCVLASKERWCWKLYCTTCGHLHFRYAFIELSQGKSPGGENWITHIGRTNYESQIGSMFSTLTSDQIEQIVQICCDAEISKISESCQFPDWLGYMGLVVDCASQYETAHRSLSKAWSKQLASLVKDGSEIEARLNHITENAELLGIGDLELCEENYTGRFK